MEWPLGWEVVLRGIQRLRGKAGYVVELKACGFFFQMGVRGIESVTKSRIYRSRLCLNMIWIPYQLLRLCCIDPPDSVNSLETGWLHFRCQFLVSLISNVIRWTTKKFVITWTISLFRRVFAGVCLGRWTQRSARRQTPISNLYGTVQNMGEQCPN